ncbi:MAG: extracellular solute-binding protein, partial [Lachnospiraceae bacterium]|nr:extracellular solute-binding protein [Lachnospiraceae bacterium]
MKKRLIALTLTGLMAVSLAACGGGSASSTAPAATAGGSESTAGGSAGSSSSGYTVSELKVNIWDNNQKAGLQQIADEWTAESGVKVSIEVVDWDNYWTLLEAGASGGQMPDVFWMHSNTAQMYMENDLLLNLDSYIEADDTIDLSKYYEGVVKLYNRADNGSQYALPKDHDTIALLYNKALFDKYGVEYPTDDWTWEDLRDAAAKITEAGKADQVYGFAMNTSNNQDGW